jgi:microcystin-dependent protein
MTTSADRIADTIADLEARLERLERGRKVSQVSLEADPIDVFDADGNLRQIYGPQDDGTYTTTDHNGPVPPTPLGTQAYTAIEAITATWSGASDVPIPNDFARVAVHVSQVDGYTPTQASEVAAFSAPVGGMATIPVLPADVGRVHYVRFVMVTTSDTWSEPTEQVAVTPLSPTAGTGLRTFFEPRHADKLAPASDPVMTAADLGSLWFDTGDGNRPYRWNGVEWESVRDGEIADASASAAQAIADAQAALTTAQAAQSTADGAIRTYYAETAPWPDGSTQPDGVLGDLWFRTSDAVAFRWNGTAWEIITDTAISEALAAAMDAQTTADGKITAWYSDTQPWANGDPAHTDDDGDLWYDTDDDNRVYYYNGVAWVDLPVGLGALDSVLAGRVLDSITTYTGTTLPAAPESGDMWLRPETAAGPTGPVGVNVLYRYNPAAPAGDGTEPGNRWVKVDDPEVQQALTDALDAANLADAKMRIFYEDRHPSLLAPVSNPQPPNVDVGDLWFDLNHGNLAWRWSGPTVGWERLLVGSDALAPGAAPPPVAPDDVALSVEAVGTVGAILLNIPPVGHESPYTAKVYIAANNPPALVDAGAGRTLHGYASGSTYRIGALPVDGQPESQWPPLALGTLYYIVVVPTNTAGQGDPSAPVTAQLHAIDTDDFSATYAYFGEVNVGQLRGDAFTLGEGTVTSVKAEGLNGASVEMHGVNGLTITGARQANGTIPVYASFPMDGTPASLPEVYNVKTELLESEAAELSGITTIVQGGRLILGASVGKPLSAPTLTTGYHMVQHPANAEDEEHSGLTRGPDGAGTGLAAQRWYTCERDYKGLGRMTVQAFDGNGAFVQEWVLSDPDGHELEPHHIVWDSFNQRFWVLCVAGAPNDNSVYVDAYSSAMAYMGIAGHTQLDDLDLDYAGRIPVLGWDHVNNRLLVAWTSKSTDPNPGRLWIDSYAKNTGAEGLNEATKTRTSTTVASGFSIEAELGYIGYGSFDFGAGVNRYVVAAKKANLYPYFYVYDPAAGARDTSREWNVAEGAWVYGACWDGSGSTGRFWHIDGGNRRRRYEGGRNTWTDQRGGKPRRVKHTWYDGNPAGYDANGVYASTGREHETPLSNASETTLPKRARLTVTVGRIPVGAGGVDDPTRARIYVGDTAGADTNMVREAEVVTPNTTYTQDTSVAQVGGVYSASSPGPFPPGVPSSLETTTGGVLVEADGDGSVGTRGFRDSVRSQGEHPGVIKMYGGPTAPAGYLLCDGSTVSRTTYQDLYNVIGTTFGTGDGGGTTFSLPDFRMRFPIGAGTSKARGGVEGPPGGVAEASRGPRHQHQHSHAGPSHDHGPGNLSTNTAGGHSHGGTNATAHTDATNAALQTNSGNRRITHIQGSTTQHNHTIPTDGDHAHNVNAGTTGPAGTGQTSEWGASLTEHPHLGVHFIIKT